MRKLIPGLVVLGLALALTTTAGADPKEAVPKLYVTNSAGDNIHVIDLRSFKVLGEIRIAVAERAGQVELQFSMTGVCGDNEVQARGLWDKAHEAMARFFLEKQLAQARQAIVPPSQAALSVLRKHERG